MINAGKEFRQAFFELLETFGGSIIVHKNFNCSSAEFIELKGMKNSEKGNSSKIMGTSKNSISHAVGLAGFIISPRTSHGSATRFAWGKQACQANGME